VKEFELQNAITTHYATRREEALKFYCELLGMKLLKERLSRGNFTLAFVGYGDESDHTVLELTYNWDVEKYLGDAYGHIALGVDITALVRKLRLVAVKWCERPMKHGSTVIAFVEDPNG